MTDLSILSLNWYLPSSFPLLIDLAKVTKISLYLDMSTSLTPMNSDCIIDLLKQTGNIHSLAIHRSSLLTRDPLSIEEIYSIIICYVHQSKLRHLAVPVRNLNQVQMLLDRFRCFFSIRFCYVNESLTPEQISAFVKTLMLGCSILEDYPVVSIWLGEQVTSSVCSSLQSIGSLVD